MRVGRLSAFVILVVATLLAIWFSYRQLGVFVLIQNVGAWVAAPIAAVFLLGVLWRRTTACGGDVRADLRVSLHGVCRVLPVQARLLADAVRQLAEPHVPGLGRLRWSCWSWCPWSRKPPDPERIKGIIWSWEVAKLPESERERNRGLRNLFLWWCIFIVLMAALYAYMMWFQFAGPGSRAG